MRRPPVALGVPAAPATQKVPVPVLVRPETAAPSASAPMKRLDTLPSPTVSVAGVAPLLVTVLARTALSSRPTLSDAPFRSNVPPVRVTLPLI